MEVAVVEVELEDDGVKAANGEGIDAAVGAMALEC